jgi:thioredoxin-like negative regulator of GroEL
MRPAADTARLLQNAHYYKMMGRPEMALRELEQAYQADPGNYKTANVLAELYEGAGNFKRAQQIYRETLALDGNNGILANNLCFSYYLAGDLSQAEACFRQTLERQPGNAAARNNLGMVLCRLGRQEEAMSLWQAAEGQVAAAFKVQQVTAALGLAGPAPAAAPPMVARGETASPRQTVRTPEVAARKASGPEAGNASRIPPPSAPAPAKASAPPTSSPAVAGQAAPVVAAAKAARPAAAVEKPPAAGDRTQADLAARPAPAGSGSPAAPAAPVAKAAAGPVKEAPRVVSSAPDAGVAPKALAGSGTVRPAPLTAKELEETAIEVQNGNGAANLARQTRSLLDQEGFNVVSIGNYIDFGVDKTTIFYRPQAEKVARVLCEKFFRGAQLTPKVDLAEDLDIKVLLGRELLTDRRVTASQSSADKAL